MNNVPVTVTISTKNRYDYLLNCINSIALQQAPPSHLLIFNDGNEFDLGKDEKYRHVFNIIGRKGILWSIVSGQKKGQHYNHQKAIEIAPTELIFRCDDDNLLESNVLSNLYELIKSPTIGAAACHVAHPEIEFEECATSASIKDVFFKFAAQFAPFKGIKEVEHLYSTFMFKKSAAKHGYNLDLSSVAHREESMFSHQICRNGFKMLVDGQTTIWHTRSSAGGIRSYSDRRFWESDEKKFVKQIADWGIIPNKYKHLHLDCGIGDLYCFKHIFPEIRKKYFDHKIVLSLVYPEVFKDETDIELISINAGKILSNGAFENQNIYRFMEANNWQRPMLDAYRAMYL